MSKLFFDHLAIREEVDFELNGFDITPEERDELIEVMDQILINAILNVVLNHLPKDKHDEFVELLKKHPHDEKLLEYLKLHTKMDIESEIKNHSRKVKQDILSEIRKHVIKKPSRSKK